MIDWARPVELNVSGEVKYREKLAPSVFVCLEEARRTYDFDRLRWAGLHFVSGQKCQPVDEKTIWPPVPAPAKAAPPKKK